MSTLGTWYQNKEAKFFKPFLLKASVDKWQRDSMLAFGYDHCTQNMIILGPILQLHFGRKVLG
jgi:hypothetical protein